MINFEYNNDEEDKPVSKSKSNSFKNKSNKKKYC